MKETVDYEVVSFTRDGAIFSDSKPGTDHVTGEKISDNREKPDIGFDFKILIEFLGKIGVGLNQRICFLWGKTRPYVVEIKRKSALMAVNVSNELSIYMREKLPVAKKKFSRGIYFLQVKTNLKQPKRKHLVFILGASFLMLVLVEILVLLTYHQTLNVISDESTPEKVLSEEIEFEMPFSEDDDDEPSDYIDEEEPSFEKSPKTNFDSNPLISPIMNSDSYHIVENSFSIKSLVGEIRGAATFYINPASKADQLSIITAQGLKSLGYKETQNPEDESLLFVIATSETCSAKEFQKMFGRFIIIICNDFNLTTLFVDITLKFLESNPDVSCLPELENSGLKYHQINVKEKKAFSRLPQSKCFVMREVSEQDFIEGHKVSCNLKKDTKLLKKTFNGNILGLEYPAHIKDPRSIEFFRVTAAIVQSNGFLTIWLDNEEMYYVIE